MTKSKRGKPTRKERRAQKKHILLGDNGEDLDTQLKVLGLTTKCITGDGNCLFRALSDQYYGYDKHHKTIRQEVCQYLEQNKDTYQFFVEDDIPFDRYLQNMRQDGCFGGHMIIVGFARLRQVDVKIYQPGMIYVIHGVEEDENDQQSGLDSNDEEPNRQVLHIAYHSWEHYSSVRNIDGPYNGMPEIKDDTVMNSVAKENDDDIEENPDGNTDSLNSKEKVILTACPGTNIRKIRRLLIRYKGKPDSVIDALYEQQNKKQDTTTTIASTNDKDDETQLEGKETTTLLQHEKIDDEKETATELRPEKQDNETQHDEKEMMTKTTMCMQQGNKDDDLIENTKAIPVIPAPSGHPKRLTAQQRKHQAKMRQKEQNREKKQKAANKHGTAKINSQSTKTDDITNDTKQAMKQLYI